MNWKKPIGILIAFFVMGVATAWTISTRYLTLTVNTTATVQDDGGPVAAEVFTGPATAVVALRESKGKQSYLLRFAGDVDWTGDTGSVHSCGSWVPPRIPILMISKHSPPCVEDPPTGPPVRSLFLKNGYLQFVADDQRTIRIKWLR